MVQIRAARLIPFALPLRTPLSTANGQIAERAGWLVCLESDTGVRGHGETSPIAGFGMESHAAAGEALVRLARGVRGAEPRDLVALLDACDRVAPDAPGARAAMDVALHDLASRIAARPLASSLAGGPSRDRVAVGALLAGDDAAALCAAARQALASGHRTCKLKLGDRALADDLARVQAVVDVIDGDAALRLDVNAGWSRADADAAWPSLSRMGIELIEQPLAREDLAGLAALRDRGGVPVALDESVVSPADLERALDAGAADWIVVKPAAAGGLRRGLAMAQRARAAGLGVFVTSLLDSAIGVAAALQLAAALPDDGAACGLATGSLLARDLAASPVCEAGAMRVPAGPGLGVVPDAAALASCRTGEAVEVFA